MERIFGRPIVTQEEMRTRIRELGRQITADYADKDLVLVGILKGAYAFYADLARALRIPMRVDFLVVTSYASKARPTGDIFGLGHDRPIPLEDLRPPKAQIHQSLCPAQQAGAPES